MKPRSVESLYSEILLLSDSERDILVNRIKKNSYHNSDIIAFTSNGKPMSNKDYLEQIKVGLQQIENGEVITDEELLKEMRTW